MLVTLLFVFFLVPEVRSCLQCERPVKVMFEDFLLSEPDVLKQIELQNIVDHALVTYRETSESRMGVIDLTTLYRARTEYQSEFERFLAMTTGSTTEAIQIMEKGREILENHLDTFIPNGLCPNQCGRLIRRVMDCTSCLYRSYTCPSPTGRQDCGKYPVPAEEGDQAVLDCFLPWHRLMLGKPEYHYSWAPGVPSSKKLEKSDFKVLVVTEDSSVVLNQLHVEESGTYQCLFQNQTGTVFYKVTFLLSVSALPTQSPRPVLTLPPLQYRRTSLRWREALVPVVAVVMASCLATSLGLAVLHREMWKRHKVKTMQDANLQQNM